MNFCRIFPTTFILLCATVMPATAQIQPALVSESWDGKWSTLIPSSGASCVHDRHDQPYNLVSSWCSKSIGISAVRYWSEQTGTRTVTKYRTKKIQESYVTYVQREPSCNTQKCKNDVVAVTQYRDREIREPYTDYEPVYTDYNESYTISKIEFPSPQGLMVYDGTVVEPELAQMLRSLPDSNYTVRLVTNQGKYFSYEIGRETIRAWKTIYAQP